MLKKLTCIIFICIFAGICGAYQLDPKKVSFKAGPSEPSEQLSFSWVEAMLYPKNAAVGDKLSVEVNLTSKAKEVSAKIDEQKESISLLSNNSTNWSAAIAIPQDIKSGLHFLEVKISEENGNSITRTLAFDVKRNLEVLYRQTFYWVKDVNGKERWIKEEEINDPAREVYLSAYNAFIGQDYEKAVELYSKAVELDPQNANAHYWLAKSYIKINEDEEAASEMKIALHLEPTHEGVNLLTNKIVRQYFREGEQALKKGDTKRAEEFFEQAVALKPSSVSEVGKLYEDAPQKSETEQSISAQQCISLVKANRTQKGTLIDSAIKSVVSMTKSLGTRIVEDGWRTDLTIHGLMVTYACRQERMGKMETEDFVFRVDPDNKKTFPSNKNAKLLMMRW